MLDEIQKQAVEMALNNDISIINGGAGTGKSFVALNIEKELKKIGFNVSKVAPTGKAAKRISGKTIHTWLDPNIEEDDWGNVKIIGFEKMNFDYKECLIVDEASMIDKELWNRILKVYNNDKHAKIVFIGDEEQLEPVGDGTPYIDSIKEKLYPVTTLSTIHRQKDGNDIIDFANIIRNGGNHKYDYNNVRKIDINEAIGAVLSDSLQNQILCPLNVYDGGTKQINRIIQDTLLENGELDNELFKQLFFDRDEWKWKHGLSIYKGDKVLITKNNFMCNVTNGTTGIATGIGTMRAFKRGRMQTVESLTISEDDGTILNVPLDWVKKSIDLAYAISIHKSQGSEYKNAIIILTKQQATRVNKKLLYTAVTRGKENVKLVI